MIPALNEAKNLPAVVTPLLPWRAEDPANREILVVDHESTDNTPQVARQLGARVINAREYAPEHHGKAQPMVAGIRYGDFDTIISLDADVLDATPKKITGLAEERKQKGLQMLIARANEGGGPGPGYYGQSGMRAFSKEFVAPLRNTQGRAYQTKWRTQLQGDAPELGFNGLACEGKVGHSQISFVTQDVHRKRELGHLEKQYDSAAELSAAKMQRLVRFSQLRAQRAATALKRYNAIPPEERLRRLMGPKSKPFK